MDSSKDSGDVDCLTCRTTACMALTREQFLNPNSAGFSSPPSHGLGRTRSRKD